MSSTFKWNDFQHDGGIYDLGHLHPFETLFTIAATQNKPECNYRFHVIFSMHCFTRKPKEGEQVPADMWYEGPKEKRIFCFDRYTLSSQLPDVIRSLDQRVCWHTHHGTFFTIEIQSTEGRILDYEIYFDVNRATRKGWLNLVVNSAFIRTEDYQANQPKKRKIGFGVIAHNNLTNKKIQPGR